MKYTSLKNDIVNILHSSDFNLSLKFYDEDGNTTLDIDDAVWGYIHNENMMIEFMTEDNPVIYLWKDKKNVDEKMKNIIQRMRELAILNGVSVQIRVYDNLDQRKIYNLIKSSIITDNKDDEEMNESLNMKKELVEAFKSIILTAKNTKKPSDFYMSEEIKNQNAEKILKESLYQISNLKDLNSLSNNELSKLLSISTYKELNEFIESLNDSTLNKLYENINNIHNINSYVKQQYINNIPFSNNENKTLFFLENVKVYKAKIKENKEDLINAYNKLISVSENAKSGLDLLKEIKKHKILETYNVSKKDLLDLWLTKNHNPIKQKYAYIIENYKGEKIAFNDKLSAGIKSIAQYINNGGDKNSQICKNIVFETIKYNNIASFIVEYKDNYSIRTYIPKFKKIFKETVEKLKSSENCFNEKIFESVEDNIDYTEYLKNLNETLGIEHSALKYLAIEEAKNNYYKTKILNEEKDNDMKILTNELRHFSPISSIISNDIIENNLNVKSSLNECNSKNIKQIASELYEQLQDDKSKSAFVVSSALFNIIHTNNKLLESKISFLNKLLKYCNKKGS